MGVIARGEILGSAPRLVVALFGDDDFLIPALKPN